MLIRAVCVYTIRLGEQCTFTLFFIVLLMYVIYVCIGVHLTRHYQTVRLIRSPYENACITRMDDEMLDTKSKCNSHRDTSNTRLIHIYD